MAFCGKCGEELRAGARFCRACGTPTAQALPTPADPTSTLPPPAARVSASLSPKVLGGVAIVALLLGIGGVATWQSGILQTGPNSASRSMTLDELAQAEFDLAAWKATYDDTFLSATETLYLTGTANARDYPTSEGTEVLGSYPQGGSVTGRWVEGLDPAVRWFRLDGGGYIWEGNIGGPDTIYPAGMSGLFVGGDYWSGFADRLSPEGIYGPEVVDTAFCEVYNSLDERFSVMFESGRATSFLTSSPQLVTQKGIRVGMSQAQLKAAYGDDLSAEPNKYEGMDYYFWRSPERGLRFYVGTGGKIESIWSGTGSIRYVEGCL